MCFITFAARTRINFLEQTKEALDLALSTGLYACFYYMHKAFPLLKESKGSIINLSSSVGMTGKAGQSSYAANKEAIRGMSRCIATEWGPYGININIICPLALTEHLKQWKEEYPDMYAKTISNIPLQRLGDPETDIGNVCVFLASDEASYISGETISIQGGAGLHA